MSAKMGTLGDRGVSNVMPKIKSSKQQLSRESLNKLKLIIEEKGWSLVQNHLEDDFGVDGVVELFIRKKKITSLLLIHSSFS